MKQLLLLNLLPQRLLLPKTAVAAKVAAKVATTATKAAAKAAAKATQAAAAEAAVVTLLLQNCDC